MAYVRRRQQERPFRSISSAAVGGGAPSVDFLADSRDVYAVLEAMAGFFALRGVEAVSFSRRGFLAACCQGRRLAVRAVRVKLHVSPILVVLIGSR